MQKPQSTIYKEGTAASFAAYTSLLIRGRFKILRKINVPFGALLLSVYARFIHLKAKKSNNRPRDCYRIRTLAANHKLGNQANRGAGIRLRTSSIASLCRHICLYSSLARSTTFLNLFFFSLKSYNDCTADGFVMSDTSQHPITKLGLRT